MPAITTTSERTGHWTKMRRPFALFSGSGQSRHTRSLAGFITATFGLRFSVHTGVTDQSRFRDQYIEQEIDVPRIRLFEKGLSKKPSRLSEKKSYPTRVGI